MLLQHKIGSFFFLCCLLSFTFLKVPTLLGHTLLSSWTSLMTVSGHSMHLLANLNYTSSPPLPFLLVLVRRERGMLSGGWCKTILSAPNHSRQSQSASASFLLSCLLLTNSVNAFWGKTILPVGNHVLPKARHLSTDFCEPARLQPCYLPQFVSSWARIVYKVYTAVLSFQHSLSV